MISYAWFNLNRRTIYGLPTGVVTATATATSLGSAAWDIEIGHDEESVPLFESDDPKALTQLLEKHSISTLSTLEVT